MEDPSFLSLKQKQVNIALYFAPPQVRKFCHFYLPNLSAFCFLPHLLWPRSKLTCSLRLLRLLLNCFPAPTLHFQRSSCKSQMLLLQDSPAPNLQWLFSKQPGLMALPSNSVACVTEGHFSIEWFFSLSVAFSCLCFSPSFLFFMFLHVFL